MRLAQCRNGQRTAVLHALDAALALDQDFQGLGILDQQLQDRIPDGMRGLDADREDQLLSVTVGDLRLTVQSLRLDVVEAQADGVDALVDQLLVDL